MNPSPTNLLLECGLCATEQAAAHRSAVLGVLAQLGHEPVMEAAAACLFENSLFEFGLLENKAKPDSEPPAIAQQALEALRLATQMRPHLQANSLRAAEKTKNKYDDRLATAQIEQLRRMMLAMASDLRVVLVTLASRLSSLRHCVTTDTAPDAGLVLEVLHVFAPLANRLGVWQLKWELEDLAFRFAQPEQYAQIASALALKREARQALIQTVTDRLSAELKGAGIAAQVYGRPKHIYSIAHKMASKNLPFEGLYDLRAVRVVVDSVRDCYTALGVTHDLYKPIGKEFDDYIARPKPNGYKSLHTVIVADDGKAVEVQIRTQAMHAFAEFGVAAHWRYKESGVKDNKDNKDNKDPKTSAEEAKVAWLRQLLAWKKDLSDSANDDWAQAQASDASASERIFVLSPQGRVIELPVGGTPIDFAYALHTDLGHRCRGAKVDGAMVTLNTALHTGQTVEILSERKSELAAGPSRDWLQPSFTASKRTQAKVRAWFNALATQDAQRVGRELVDKELARLGKTAVSLAELAQDMGYPSTDALYIAAAKPEFSTRSIEHVFADEPAPIDEDEQARSRIALAHAKVATHPSKSDVLVVGVDMLLTQLARCCKPAPPDAVCGYVTRGKGVSIHRAGCASLKNLAAKEPQRLIDCDWGESAAQSEKSASTYPVEVRVLAADRQGLLRDVSDAFMKHKINVTAVQTHSARGEARMSLSAQVDSIAHLGRALASLREVKGVVSAQRR